MSATPLKSKPVSPCPPLVVLAGNPNCGKTSLFNAMTGLRYKVANYPGVTVEKREALLSLPDESQIRLVDLPGMYSLDGHSLDEVIAANAVQGLCAGESTPDVVVSIADSTNLERCLLLTTQLIDLGQPVILALNMADLAEKQGLSLKSEIISRELGIPVYATSAVKGSGIKNLLVALQGTLKNPSTAPASHPWPRDTDGRFHWIESLLERAVVKAPEKVSGLYKTLDELSTHKIMGPAIFLLIMAFIFQAIYSWASLPMDAIEYSISWLGQLLNILLPDGQLKSLLVDGVVAGVGSIIIFVPQIAILFFFIGLLEDSGYLSRAAFIMDRLMRLVGLQGRSFIPLLSSFACAVPGIMAARTIPSRSDRLITILIAPLMSCSARLPVYAVLIGAFIPAMSLGGLISLQGLVLLGLYLFGIVSAALVAWLLRLSILKGDHSPFVMELPPFRCPSLRVVLRAAGDRVYLFIKNAGTIILACSIVLWFLASYPQGEIRDTYAGRIGRLMEPAIAPLGYNWEIGVGLLASFAAREVFISSLSTVYNLQEDDPDSHSLTSLLRDKQADGTFGLPVALSLMAFFALACQCMSTLAVCRRETSSWRWTSFMFLYMTLLAWLAAFATYNISRMFLE